MLTPQEGLEIGRDADEGGRGGVKRPAGAGRSPRPGGLRGGIDHNEHPWGLRWRVSEADRAAVRIRRSPVSRGSFILQEVGDELLMPRACPENTNENGPACVAALRSPAPRGTPPRTQTACGGEAVRQRAEIRGQRAGQKESPRDFVSQSAGNEWLMRHICPEIGGGGEGRVGGSSCWGGCLGASGGREFCRLGSRRYSRLGNLRYTWRNVVPPGRKPSPFALSSQDEDTGWVFLLHDAGGQSVMTLNFQEFSGEAGSASSATPRCYLPAHCGDDTAVGQRGILTHDHDPSSPSSVAEPLRRVDLNHNLVSFGPARGIPPRPLKGNPSASGWSFIPQDPGGELVMALDCPEIGGGGGQGVELIGLLITKVHAGFRMGMGGTLALTPALSRSGENSPKPNFVLLAPESKSAQPIDNQCHRFWLHGEGEFSATRRQGGCARLARRLAAEIRELPVSRGSFILQEVGDELLMPPDCPEITNESGPACVAALRSPAPRGLRPAP